MTNKERFIQYNKNIKKVWKDRLTWRGLYGDTPKFSTNATIFLNENLETVQSELMELKNVLEFRKFCCKLAKQYVDWVNTTVPGYTVEETEDMYISFIGFMGEIFFICLLDNIKCFAIGKQLYHFTNVAPLLASNDFGVDGTATYAVGDKEIDCALQIKFWNPNIDTPFTLKIAQGVGFQAVCDGYIKPTENKNIVICWLGTDDKVSRYLKQDKSVYQHLVFIDMKVLNFNINDQVPFFWKDILPSYLQNIVRDK